MIISIIVGEKNFPNLPGHMWSTNYLNSWIFCDKPNFCKKTKEIRNAENIFSQRCTWGSDVVKLMHSSVFVWWRWNLHVDVVFSGRRPRFLSCMSSTPNYRRLLWPWVFFSSWLLRLQQSCLQSRLPGNREQTFICGKHTAGTLTSITCTGPGVSETTLSLQE